MAEPVELDANDIHNLPPDTSLAAMPDFEQPVASTLSLLPSNDPEAVAHVFADDDKHIYVDRPQLLSNPVLAHEVVHQIQNRAGADNTVEPTASSYDYGGAAGLAKTPSISTLNDEQQANIPRDYMFNMDMYKQQLANPQAGKIKGGLRIPSVTDTLKEADRMNSSYARPLHQLANMANQSSDTIDTTPQPPGPPPAVLTGMIKPLPEIGGKTIVLQANDIHNKPTGLTHSHGHDGTAKKVFTPSTGESNIKRAYQGARGLGGK
jgi:hypothetical protein